MVCKCFYIIEKVGPVNWCCNFLLLSCIVVLWCILLCHPCFFLVVCVYICFDWFSLWYIHPISSCIVFLLSWYWSGFLQFFMGRWLLAGIIFHGTIVHTIVEMIMMLHLKSNLSMLKKKNNTVTRVNSNNMVQTSSWFISLEICEPWRCYSAVHHQKS